MSEDPKHYNCEIVHDRLEKEIARLRDALDEIKEIIDGNYEDEVAKIKDHYGHMRSMSIGASEAIAVVKSGVDDVIKDALQKSSEILKGE